MMKGVVGSGSVVAEAVVLVRPQGSVLERGLAELSTAPSRRWTDLIAWTYELGLIAVCSGSLVGEIEAVVLK